MEVRSAQEELEQRRRDIMQLEQRKQEIQDDMQKLVDEVRLRTFWSLELQDIYCTKKGVRYGPYGPYYYLFRWEKGRLVSVYIGKDASDLKLKISAMHRLRQLEKDYRELNTFERHRFPLPDQTPSTKES